MANPFLLAMKLAIRHRHLSKLARNTLCAMAWCALALLVAGIGGLVGGTITGSVLVVRIGAAAFLGGSLFVAAQYPRMFSGRPAGER